MIASKFPLVAVSVMTYAWPWVKAGKPSGAP